MNAMLLDLLRRRCQVRFTRSLASDRAKCWVRLEGAGELAASEWRESPAAALAEAHARALALVDPDPEAEPPPAADPVPADVAGWLGRSEGGR